ncbi:Ribosomal protein S17e [Cynara cardunculus var. scolymus]|uniref:Ribosomal protein S17e n=2 Tax=Cardueae TaxID=102818 RepID=A0A103XCM0_CYNCS|nr:Ribosomal protein S17e [Cynara cardunculus var. scolymus]
MGRVRTKTVKKSSRLVIERYYSKMTLDFHTNKKILEEVAIIPSKRLRNKIAGFSTHLMKRIQKGPVRGISLKLQEEERERRMDFVPDESAIKTDRIEVDKETIDLLASLGMSELPGIVLKEDTPMISTSIPGGFGGGRGGYGGGAGRRYMLKTQVPNHEKLTNIASTSVAHKNKAKTR